MTNTTKQLIINHGIKIEDMEKAFELNKVLYFKEFDEGFVSLLRLDEYDFLLSSAVDDVYGFSMWKYLIKMIDNRERPIMVSFGNNVERLFKASKRYDFEKIDNKTIIIKF